MYERCTDEEVFKRFWKNDATDTPKHFQASTRSFDTSWEDYLAFCLACERVYLLDDVALLYIERVGDNANIHFSLIRGERVDVNDLLAIRNALFKDYQIIYGWCGNRNKGLRQMLEACGLKWRGFTMHNTYYRGRVMAWHCHSLSRQEFSLLSDKMLVNLA